MASRDFAVRLAGITSAAELVSRKGVLLVLTELMQGPLRYNDLARVTQLDNKQLSRALRVIEDAGLVDRRVRTHQTPVLVQYQLTRRARDLVSVLDALESWWEAGSSGGEGAAQPRHRDCGSWSDADHTEHGRDQAEGSRSLPGSRPPGTGASSGSERPARRGKLERDAEEQLRAHIETEFAEIHGLPVHGTQLTVDMLTSQPLAAAWTVGRNEEHDHATD